MIIGVLPRTRSTTLSDAPFGTKSGFYGDLEDNGIISGEFNEQVVLLHLVEFLLLISLIERIQKTK